MNSTEKMRYNSIDALRGVAAILMIEQHLGFWLWDVNAINASNFFKYPLIISLNALGGIAAPIFVTLAGFGSVCYLDDPEKKSKSIIIRGLIITAYGYLLNIIVPSWFSAGSWYVLHLIGSALILSSFFYRLSSRNLLIVTAASLIAASALQIFLDTPSLIDNSRMRDFSMPGGILRLALAEGHFPLFPWLAFFTSGMVSGRLFKAGNRKKLLYLALALMIAGFIIGIPSFVNLDVMRTPIGRVFLFSPMIYPASPPMTLILMGIAHLGIYIAYLIGQKIEIKESNFLVNLGRVSLTLLVFHVFVFRELSIRLGLNNLLGMRETLIMIAALICILGIISIQWRKSGFKFSLEQLMRKIAG